MEDLARYKALAALALAVVAAFAPQSALAYEEDGNVDARTDNDGVDVEIEVGHDGRPRTRGRDGSGGTGCEWSTRRYPYTGAEPPARFGDPPSPDHDLYLLYCDGEYVSTEWLGPAADTATESIAGLVQRILREIPVDLATIGIQPEDRAVTGLPSLFWVEGYRGEPIEETVDELGVVVDVEVTFGTVEWDFGDGTPTTIRSLGKPWPEESDVRHAYQHKGPKTVTVTLTLDARYRVDGGDWHDLTPITRRATRTLQVDEVQATRDR